MSLKLYNQHLIRIVLTISTYSDRELLQAIRQDNKAAFTELFRRYWKQAHAITYARVRSVDATQEIVQNLFITIWDKRATLSIQHFPAYLHVSIKNRALNFIASRITRQKHWDYYKQFIKCQENVTEHDVELDELMEALEDGIDGLPEKSRKIFRLHRMEGRSITEIANSLNLSEKAIQYHVLQSIKKLKLHLKDYILAGSLVLIICF